MKAKRFMTLGLVAAISAATLLTGCGNNDTSAATSGVEETKGVTGDISVISREDGSGTRGAFVELLGIEQKNEAGEKIDYTTLAAEITNSTAVMITTVEGNKNAIGYISLGSLGDTVTAVKVDGVAPSAEAVKDGSYPVARPFNIVYDAAAIDEVTNDFITFIMSDEGQAIVEEEGYVSQGSAGTYKVAGLTGEITIGGSSSVTPVMEVLAENYEALNPNVTIEVQMSDSTTGVTSAAEGVCNIGMASRGIKDAEKELGLTDLTIAMDGIAVIVNKANTVETMTSEQIKEIYVGNILTWDEITK